MRPENGGLDQQAASLLMPIESESHIKGRVGALGGHVSAHPGRLQWKLLQSLRRRRWMIEQLEVRTQSGGIRQYGRRVDMFPIIGVDDADPSVLRADPFDSRRV